MERKPVKPLGHKSYGSIPHLQGSKRGPADKGVNDGQQRICCERVRDKHDTVIVQEKLDGTNVSVAKIDGRIVPLIRAGYEAVSSHWKQHRLFAAWAFERQEQFDKLLNEGERVCGEWLAQASGVRYELGETRAFAAFDIMQGMDRLPALEMVERVTRVQLKIVPFLMVMEGGPVPLELALRALGRYGHYGAQGEAEGVVYRVERKGKVDFLAKYVRPDFPTGQYLPGTEGAVVDEPVWNWKPH